MPFPNFNYCLICDLLHPEGGGKVTILGFYGLAPNVEVALGNLAQPLNLTFFGGFSPIQDIRPYFAHLVVTKPNNTVAFQSPPVELQIREGHGGAFGIIASIAPPILLVPIPFAFSSTMRKS